MGGILRFWAEFPVFGAPFRPFRSKMEKTAKVRFEPQVPLAKRLYTKHSNCHPDRLIFFRVFSFLCELGRQKCPGEQKISFWRHLAPKSAKMRFLRFGPENTSQNLMFIKVSALVQKGVISMIS